MLKFARHIIRIIIAIFATIGIILTGGYFAVKFGLTNTKGIIDDRFITHKKTAATSSTDFLNNQYPGASAVPVMSTTSDAWRQSEEWQVLKTATAKDALLVNQVATLTDVSPRLLVAQLVVEQLRLFTSEREVYKQIFAPLKILGNQSQFSWGVVGLKEETAKQIERNLKDTNSPYYLGPRYEHLLDFSTANPDEERFTRVTARDHYYAYLYAALYLKQIQTQWQKAGFPISDRPEILSTLYNIGFNHSQPNQNPAVGGALIELGGEQYSFGGLAYEFYYSNELLNEFPR